MQFINSMSIYSWGSNNKNARDWADEYYMDDIKAAKDKQPDYELLTEYWAEGLEERQRKHKHLDERSERYLARKFYRKAA